MDPKVVIPLQARGGGKVKNEPAQGINRRVLRDIGNLEAVRAVEGKPHNISRPLTRRYAALLANAQAVAENKNSIAAVADGVVAVNGKGDVVTKAVAAQKAQVITAVDGGIAVNGIGGAETKAAAVQKLLPDEEQKAKPVSGRRSRERSSRKGVKTLTSILAALSKAACELPNRLKDQILNIDAEDVNDELAVIEYIDDLHQFYKLTEERAELQLVGISSMLIACKYEEIWAPQVHDFVGLSDYAYGGEQVLVMEKSVLGKLGWYLTVPTPYVFLVRYIKASVSPDQQMENMVFFLAELGIMHYSTIILHCPSLIAAAAVYAARCTLNKSPFWSETLMDHTGYSEEQLMDCAKLLVSFHLAGAESKLKVVFSKFSNPERGAVALFAPARSLLAI